jgi:hypothetical protein
MNPYGMSYDAGIPICDGSFEWANAINLGSNRQIIVS